MVQLPTKKTPAGISPLSLLKSSNDMTKMLFTLKGSPGVGKTYAAATASHKWETKTLDDMLWIASDQGALNGLRIDGVEVPHVVDFPEVAGTDVIKGVETTLRIVQAAEAELPQLKYVVLDTLSSLDSMICSYWEEKKANFDVWKSSVATHKALFAAMQRSKLTWIVLCHTKAQVLQDIKGEATPAHEGKKAKLAAAGDIETTNAKAAYVLDLKYDDVRRWYTSQSDLSGTVEAKYDMKEKALVRSIRFDDDDRRPTGDAKKNRLRAKVGSVESTDLRALFNKLDC